MRATNRRSQPCTFSTGIDPESGKPSAYIGEAEVLRDRLRQHRNKDFWVSVVAFVSKDENLTKAHIRFLEGELIKEATTSGRAKLENGTSSGHAFPRQIGMRWRSSSKKSASSFRSWAPMS